MHHLITDIGIAVIVATVAGYLAFRLKQPIILAYFLAGIIIGPEIGPQLVSDHESIEIISEIGLILLLFVIGLEMNPEKVLSMARQLLLPGLGQFVLTVALAAAVFAVIGPVFALSSLDIIYLAIAVSLSSTAIVIKMLHDRYEIDSIHGRISVGILIFQDIWAIFVIVLQPRFGNPTVLPILFAVARGVALVGVCLLFSRYVLKPVFEAITRTPEMVVAVSLGWCALAAGTASAIGLSMEMGALIAGISIASFPYSMHVTLKIQPLRDFFLTLFFISLGMKITMPDPDILIAVPVIILVTLASRFIVLYPLLRGSGAGRRNAFLASLNLAQVSEFSLVIAAIGISLHHIDKKLMSMLIYSMAMTAILSSYTMRYGGDLYRFLFARMERGDDEANPAAPAHVSRRDVFILGYHRGARALLDYLRKHDPAIVDRIVVIDFNQEVLRELRKQKIHCLYGDVSNEDALEHAHISKARFIISTIPDLLLRGTDNMQLVRTCRRLNPEGFIIANADVKALIHPLKRAGANYVVLPYTLVAEEIALMFLERQESQGAVLPAGL